MNSPILTELRRGVLPAADLRARLGVSPATLMRLARSAGPALLRIGRARATRYAARQPWPGLDSSRFPVVRVTATGRAIPAGEIVTLAARESVWLPEGAVTAGLPVAVADARPAGFLGRHFAAVHADLHLPSRPDEWSDHNPIPE